MFPGTFTRKLYFLVHSPWLTLECGSPCSHWCMWFEAKQHFKSIARNTSYVNVCQTLAKRQQLRQCWEWQPESLIKEDHIVTSVSELSPQEFPTNLKAAFAVDEKPRYIVLNFIKYAIGDLFIFNILHATQIPEMLGHPHSYQIRETDKQLMFKPEDEEEFCALGAYRSQ